MSFKVYQKFESSDIISGKDSVVSSGFFPDGGVSFFQTDFTTSSVQAQAGTAVSPLNGSYYLNVYDNSITNPQVLFSVAYGDVNGGGAGDTGSAGYTVQSTKAIYSQYKNLLLGYADPTGIFSFLSGSVSSPELITGSRIIVLNFSSQLQQNQIDVGQWSIGFKSVGGVSISLIDDSLLLTSNKKNQSVYQIIRGFYDENSGTTSIENQVSSGSYEGLGLFYPKAGIMILNADKLNDICPIENWSTSANGPFLATIFNNLKRYSARAARIRKSEIIPSSHYFVRVKNSDFNFSNNPTFVYQESDAIHSRGDIIDDLIQTPTTYITTVGLYNDLNELVAVAKLSRPTKKDFTNELLIRIRIDV